MKNSKRGKTTIIIILAAAAVLIGIIGAAFLFYAMNYKFSPEISHFYTSSASVITTSCILIASFLLSSAAYITAGKNIFIKKEKQRSGFFDAFFATLAACVTLLSGLSEAANGNSSDKPFIFIIRTVFTFLSVIFFITEALGVFNRIKNEAGIAALIPSVMFAFTILGTYFDPSTAMNSLSKTLEIVMLVSFMLYFKDIAGVAISRQGLSRKLIFSGIFASSAGGTVAAARFFSSFMYGSELNLSITETSLSFVIWIYILFRFTRNMPLICENNKDSSLNITEKTDENIDCEEPGEYENND